MKAKPFFMVFVIMAILPLLLAYLVLKLGWYTPGATAKGQFVQSDIQIEVGEPSNTGMPVWQLVVQPEQQCLSTCEELLYGLNQTFIALGKLQKRVSARVLSPDLDLSLYPKLSKISAHNPQLSSKHFYLVDPFGKVILQYPVGANREQTIASSKAILADIKKLLKYSRVG